MLQLLAQETAPPSDLQLIVQNPVFVFWVAIAVIVVVPTVTTAIATAWYKMRRADIDADLKHRMLEAGMSADEIERVLQAGSENGQPEL